jgi:hypothetical protein
MVTRREPIAMINAPVARNAPGANSGGPLPKAPIITRYERVEVLQDRREVKARARESDDTRHRPDHRGHARESAVRNLHDREHGKDHERERREEQRHVLR